jgi:D-methionine transport system substrate-binding protein
MIRFIYLILLATLISACHSKDESVIKVGTIAGPETQLMEVAKQVAKEKYGLNIRIIEFTDYLQPNAALNDGSIDANVFQHQAFLDQQAKDRGYHLIAIGRTFVYPMGIYSSKTKSLETIPNGALVAIPSDPSNEGRALLLLQKAGLLRLKQSAGLYATPLDITENPKQLKFKELDAAQLARSLPDVMIAVINTNYAIPAGLSPDNAIYKEESDSPYANIIVVRTEDQNSPCIKQLVEAIQSDAVLKSAKEVFNGYAIAAWK